MNKTVNINLVGISFHIDEDAYGKLSRYLSAIRESLKATEGSEEIMRDIEARIAELFLEKVDSHTQVITLKDLEEVIAVMGQPEDYEVEAEDSEDSATGETSRLNANKKLFRDIDDKFIAGVSSGIGHYIGIDALWIRLLWIILVVAGMGSPILIYILLWVLMPAAISTSDKLKMKGEPINISNIEKKFKEGFDNVTDKVKNADYNKVKEGTSSFFDTLGNIIVILFKVFVKLIGLFIIFLSLSVLITLVVSFFSLGTINIWGNSEITEYIAMVDTTNIPLWLSAILILFAIGIPFLALFILGLKLLISNLKAIGTTPKILMLVLWVISIIGLTIVGIKQVTQQAYDGNFVVEETLPITAIDTLYLSMNADHQYDVEVRRRGKLKLKYNKNNDRIIYSNNISLNINSTKDSIGRILINKKAEGNSHLEAKNKAEAIEYSFDLRGNRLFLDGFFTSDITNKFRNQKMEITLILPENTVISPDKNMDSYYSYSSKPHIVNKNGDYYKISRNGIESLDCVDEIIPVETDSIQMLQNTDSISPNWEKEMEQEFDKY